MKRLFSVYGDSISTFEGITPEGWSVFYQAEQREITGVEKPCDTWWMQVIDHFGGELLSNAAWSGCVCEGDAFPQGASERRIEALERDGKAPDDILIYIGINDYGWGSAYAQICGGSPNAPADLVASCPDKGKVAGLAPEYNHAIAHAAAATPNCTLVDAAALGFDYEAIDGTHPTKRGMKQLAAMYIQGMEVACDALPRTPYEGSDLLTDDMRTVEFCAKPCVGCEFAKGTGNNWWHVCEKQLQE